MHTSSYVVEMTQFSDIIEKYRSESESRADQGTKFEEIIARYLMTDPVYANQLQWAKLWIDFSRDEGLRLHDVGIDIVAKTKFGEYWAIQCKCYASDSYVSKDDIDSFISASGRSYDGESGKIRFSNRIVIATTLNWSQHALNMQENQEIPVTLVGYTVLEESDVDWNLLEKGTHGASARHEPYELRDHQKAVLKDALEYYKDHDRGNMVMACGTGKTFTSLRIAEKMTGEKGTVLFLAPSISLIGQTLREWMNNMNYEINPICVCSDKEISKAKDEMSDSVVTLGSPATTDPKLIVSRFDSSMMNVIFSTYQSIDAVIDAQKMGFPEFDLVVCDEAHRTVGQLVGKDESYFTKVHSNENIKAVKRLYMTATPRLYGEPAKKKANDNSIVLYSMDDPLIYGEKFHHLKFGDAVEKDLLSDYRVAILTVSESEVPHNLLSLMKGKTELDTDYQVRIWGTFAALNKKFVNGQEIEALDPEPMKSAVMFTSTIKRSREFAKAFNTMTEMVPPEGRVEVKHIDGSMYSTERSKLMTWLKTKDPKCRILSNVRCLSEGVDVPALDAVIFMDEKNSLVDIVQSVGRVMRKAPGKKYGYVIIPVVVPDDQDPDVALDSDNFKVVWSVLRALRSHDERLESEINTIMFKKSPGSGGHIRIPGGDDYPALTSGSMQFTMDDFATALYAKLINKVGDREYITHWAEQVAVVMPKITEQIEKICIVDVDGKKEQIPSFRRYHKGIQSCVNNNVSVKDAINMLAQQIVTKPIFEKLFKEGGDFVMDNSVSKRIDIMIDDNDMVEGMKGIQKELNSYYEDVERTLSQIETNDGRQAVITSLYEKFFKKAFPKDQTINGVVYTPTTIVDFIINSVSDALKEEFNLDLAQEGVNILDPFTGTGTFIARLMESGLIPKEDLYRKYKQELYANEITLLAYYIATVNIENTYARVMEFESYESFDNILLTDTFNIGEICKKGTQTTFEEEYFVKNKKRIRREHDLTITVIIGNPPYGANQKSANDNAKKRTYEGGIDGRISETYLDDSLFSNGKGNVNSVYDNYVRAYRWSTDRIGDNDGVIAFVTPSGWLTGSAFEGFRKTIESEFSKIYILNLRGDANTQGQRRRDEGDGIFGEGSRTPIAITMLVRHKGESKKAEIFYVQTPDGAKRNEKLTMLKRSESFTELNESKSLQLIHPKPNGDWIIERDERFNKMIPIAGDTHKKFEKHSDKSIFTGFSRGYGTSRDAWVYRYSIEKLKNDIETVVFKFNELIEANGDPYISGIPLDQNLLKDYQNKKKILYSDSYISSAIYRPFVKQYLYADQRLIHETASIPRILPSNNTENRMMCVASVGDKKDFSCLIVNINPDLHLTGTSQIFPLYWYEESVKPTVAPHQSTIDEKSRLQTTLFADEGPRYKRKDGISNFALKTAVDKYGMVVTKEDIFYYVYGYLHSPEYRKSFSEDLKLSLPKIDFVQSYDNFKKISEAGRKLAELHLNYEKVEPWGDLMYNNGRNTLDELLSNDDLCKVRKMKIDSEKGEIVYNDAIVISNIPKVAFDYTVNGRSALGWLQDQYQISTDKMSGIVNDPNDYAGGSYILKLVASVVTVSVKTMEIIESMPSVDFNSIN